MQAGKETAANIAASARSGMEKTKATALEKVEQMKTRDPMMKDMATQKKEAKIQEVEREKQGAMQQNRLARHEAAAGGYGHGFTAIGDPTAVGGAGGADISGAGHATGGAHVPGTGHATGGAHVPGTGHETGGAHIPGTGHDTGGAHIPGMGHETGGAHLPGTGHDTGGAHIPGTGHTGHHAI